MEDTRVHPIGRSPQLRREASSWDRGSIHSNRAIRGTLVKKGGRRRGEDDDDDNDDDNNFVVELRVGVYSDQAGLTSDVNDLKSSLGSLVCMTTKLGAHVARHFMCQYTRLYGART